MTKHSTTTVLPENFIKASKETGFTQNQIKVNLHENYDHSYYFISTFAPEHVKFHATILKAHL
jgi:S-formylglutathione hydrolase